MDTTPAQRIHAYITEYCAAAGLSTTAWAKQNGIAASSVGRWESGETPELLLHTMHEVAAALRISTIDLLQIGGYGDIGSPAVARPVVPTVDVAIEVDPSLSDGDREFLRSTMAILRANKPARGVRASTR